MSSDEDIKVQEIYLGHTAIHFVINSLRKITHGVQTVLTCLRLEELKWNITHSPNQILMLPLEKAMLE
nr:hypothetical protein CFP56_49756 [Quercus suber]